MQVKINYDICQDNFDFYVWDKERNIFDAKQLMIEVKVTPISNKHNMPFKPSFSIKAQGGLDETFGPFMKALAEKGLYLHKSAAEAELIATKAHLASLQASHNALLEKFSRS
jgi:hypothetical protein